MSKHHQKSDNFLKDFAMGGVTGAIAKTANAPIERVKILLQIQQTHAKLANKQYTGILNCFLRIYQEEGLLAYWKGNLTNCIRYFPTTAINFSVKDTLRALFMKGVDQKKQPTQYFVNNLLSGGIAGAIGLTCVYSLDFARTRLGADVHGKKNNPAEREFKGLFDCYQKIFKSDGILGLYRGFGISVLGIFIYRAFYFGLYDMGKELVWGNEEEQKKASFIIKFFFAQTVVMTSETLSFPIDTIRRRMMMQSGRKGAEMKYKNTLDCWKKTIKEEGWTGLFKGNLSNLWRSIGSSLCLVLYDKMKQEWFAEKKDN